MSTPDSVETKAAPNAAAFPFWRQRLVVAIAAVAALLLALQWYDNHQQMKTLQAELARRLAAADAESRGVADQVRDTTRDAQSRLESLDARVHESLNRQIALEATVQELAKGRDELLLADIEQTLLVANQQVQATGNARYALTALQSIDARLARLDRAQFAALRKVVSNDIDKLKTVPRVDLAAIAALIDEVAASVDSLPLLIEARPSDAPAARKAPPPEAGPWLRFAREFWQDVRELVRVERIDNADGMPLSLSQAYFLRENLRLRLLGARVALLAHNEKSYKADLKAARDWLARYFDNRNNAVTRAVATVRQLHESAITIELPDVTASLDAVRNFRATGERR